MLLSHLRCFPILQFFYCLTNFNIFWRCDAYIFFIFFIFYYSHLVILACLLLCFIFSFTIEHFFEICFSSIHHDIFILAQHFSRFAPYVIQSRLITSSVRFNALISLIACIACCLLIYCNLLLIASFFLYLHIFLLFFSSHCILSGFLS